MKLDEGRKSNLADMKSWILGKGSLIVLSTFLCSMYLLAYNFNVKIYDVFTLKRFTAVTLTNSTKRILYWNTMFGDESFYLGYSFDNCPVSNCYAIHDRFAVADLTEFDAVLFHANELDLSDLPKKRSPRQWYVFVNLESPANRPLIHYFYEDYFNLTMTYRLDSDIVWTYATIEDAHTGDLVAPLRNNTWTQFYDRAGDRANDTRPNEAIAGKTKPIVWFVSNCNAKSGRDKYVLELSRHVTVDIYGKCGNHHCPRSKDCFREVAEPDYFFYLSFENSLCEDYVTEKLYNALRYNIVPIVYGGANYSVFAPPGSYINALDYDSPRELAGYLKTLMKNPREYAKYFRWKKYYRINKSSRSAACNLCEFLHKRSAAEPRWYSPLTDWYSRGKCPLQSHLNDENYATGAISKERRLNT
ncbi:alpha-(1,3)-fucosyltransferase C [Nomia melanderi]|uniref:alpha-(1,3)-fucosyltransferase C n=1 Tax=Nomia melanderi TaxID=2448451 RepID=UPI001304206A|nr:alpha-(1,3)-fucosyltransferase C-like [Nomia melanderi]XP_031847171.1 alpha-(1,3)-fucosyltransferase C-like [Nomia melanderi]XP_031847172.1 alpha-(1,3)-fucosyltransferase C-like [Nomia melanderi]XP_031847173.1 alpha-(1,3)-fucosyltransferase C-like [Nomia melanderi]XP_031847174.1 alpha-(1,3)-fucosyltransferase C-like [Nomia melanderi]XP_031847176.1 alpha-(1,3)-fucosyltransferase C-like [Nomia melanderi]XP_031847177.1 alpha-(1,3)-fucosyltransferase C-like [Nomia melanderi]XP_031847178.1 alp